MSKRGDSILNRLRRVVISNFAFFARKLKLDKAISKKIKQAGIPVSPEEYAAGMIFLFFVAFVFTMPLFILIFLLSGKNPITAFISSIFLAGFVGLVVFLLAYLYLEVKISEKIRNISANLPFATIYMATLASSGLPPLKIFEALSTFGEFGEISKEAKKIVREVNLLGRDLVTALENAAQRTPSTAFKELLWGMRSTITSGGDLTAYLVEKSRTFSENFRLYLDRYVSQLYLITEIYITLVIVGSIFLVVMSIILGFLGEPKVIELAKMGIYFGIPLASVLVLLLIYNLSPEV